MKTLAALLSLAAAIALGGCSKPAPEPLPAVARTAVAAELAPLAVACDDNAYSPIEHTWLERAIDRHVAKTWHDRAYVPEAKDCDDFTDYLVSQIRHQFGEQAAKGSGGALIGRYTVWTATGTHRVAIVRTDRGWFIADPQTLTRPPRTIPLVPRVSYKLTGLSAAF